MSNLNHTNSPAGNAWNNSLNTDQAGSSVIQFTPNIRNIEFKAFKQIKNSKLKSLVDVTNQDIAYLLPVKIKSRILQVRIIPKIEEIREEEVFPDFANYAYPRKRLTKPKNDSVISKFLLPFKKVNRKKTFAMASVSSTFIIIISLLTGFTSGVLKFDGLKSFSNLGQVAGVSESVNKEDELYKNWIQSKNNNLFINADDDTDNDGLTNKEEFILDTNPLSKYTCSKDKTDAQLLVALINPKTCNPINFDSDIEVEKFSPLLNIQQAKENLVSKAVNTPITENPSAGTDSLLQLFGVKSYSEIAKIDTTTIKENAKLADKKVEYVRLVGKIDDYIKQYRSYDVYDRDYETPVQAAKFLEVSIEYDTPLKYVLALARNESRFGTDRFTASGNPTRPNTYKNIYSIGLTGSSSSGYNTWDEGVEAFGKWYKSFQDRGVSDCRKWRIYNPNGDYCTKIEEMAGDIQAFLDK
jgi:hypothetical protein